LVLRYFVVCTAMRTAKGRPYVGFTLFCGLHDNTDGQRPPLRWFYAILWFACIMYPILRTGGVLKTLSFGQLEF